MPHKMTRAALLAAALIALPVFAQDEEADDDLLELQAAPGFENVGEDGEAEPVVDPDWPELVAANPDAWREVAPENLLRFDTDLGRVLIEFAPEYAPGHVERFTELASEGFYDGTLFHRVIPDFMAQGGDPSGTGSGGSELPDLQAEFTTRLALGDEVVSVQERVINERQDPDESARASFRNGFAIGHQPVAQAAISEDGAVETWILHCPGTTSSARTGDPNSANSQFFLMRGTANHLDAQYTAWGRVVMGLDVVQALETGEPPRNPSRILEAHVQSDLQPWNRDRVWVLRTESEAFAAHLSETRQAAGSDFDICDLQTPTAAYPGPEAHDSGADALLDILRNSVRVSGAGE